MANREELTHAEIAAMKQTSEDKRRETRGFRQSAITDRNLAFGEHLNGVEDDETEDTEVRAMTAEGAAKEFLGHGK